MKKYITLSLSLLFASGMYAQKNEIKSIKKILDKKSPTEADYKDLQGLIDAATPYIGNSSPEEQAEFYYLKGSYELQKALKVNSVDDFTKAVESFNKLKSAEQNAKRKTFTDKFNNELLPVLRPEAFQKALDFSNNKKYREASNIFKAMYDLDKDPLNLYYAASMSVTVPDYNTALVYYQELLDMNFTGEGVYYTALNKKTGERENFGDNKNLMTASVKGGEYSNPKEEKDPSKKPEILKNMVLIYKEVNQNSRAEKLLQDARRESPDDLDLMLVEAEFHLQNNEMGKFEALMQQAVSKDPNNPDLYYNLGITSAQAGNTAKAEEYYNKAIQINPNYVNAHLNLGVIKMEGDGKIVDQMNALGISREEQKKYDDLKKQRETLLKTAIPHFERVLVIEPNNQSAISSLIGIYGALDMTDEQQKYKAKLKN